MKVAFTLIGGESWTGGIHYLKNLLYALHSISERSLSSTLFVRRNTAERDVEFFRPFVDDMVVSGAFAMWHPLWAVRQVVRRLLDRDLIVESMLKDHDIDVAFHFGPMGRKFPIPTVSWIPDLQPIHMPEMYSARERDSIERKICARTEMSSRLMVSSETAKRDLLSLVPECSDKVDVLRFVAQISADVYNAEPLEILKDYDVPAKFFHLPNQFWKHKNHTLVIDALKVLRGWDENVFVVCTGRENDYRNPHHFERLKEKIRKCGVENNIALLGLVPIEHLYAFMRQSVAVLNPSLFEGWSTTVEEAKSLGKRVLVSDIHVHREQNAPGASYFDPMESEDLADKMSTVWKEYMPGPDLEMEERARSLLQSRTKKFGREFVNILEKAKRCCVGI